MTRIEISALPDGFHVVPSGLRENEVTVIYDVTPQDYGTWTGCEIRDGYLCLFPQRSYRHKDLMKRLGLVVPD